MRVAFDCLGRAWAAGEEAVKGTLAPDGAIVKVAGLHVLEFEGPARVFDDEQSALQAILDGKFTVKVNDAAPKTK